MWDEITIPFPNFGVVTVKVSVIDKQVHHILTTMNYLSKLLIDFIKGTLGAALFIWITFHRERYNDSTTGPDLLHGDNANEIA